MLSFHLCLGIPCDLLVRGFHLNIFLTVLVSGILCTWPNQLSFFSTISPEKLWVKGTDQSSSLCSFLHSPIHWSLLDPNTLLNALFSNTLSLCPSVNVGDQVSHPHNTTGCRKQIKIISFSVFWTFVWWEYENLHCRYTYIGHVFTSVHFLEHNFCPEYPKKKSNAQACSFLVVPSTGTPKCSR